MGAENQDTTKLQPHYQQDNAANPVKAPIFSCSSKQEWLLFLYFVFMFVFIVGLAIFLGITEGLGIGLLVGAEILIFVLIVLIFPKRLEVWHDSVKVVLVCGYKHSISMNTIVYIDRASLCEFGLKCATSVRNRVRITRSSGLNVIVTPSDPEGFIFAVRQVISPSLVVV